MAAVLSRQNIGLRSVGNQVSVAEDPRAKLMFYLNCICDVLDLDDSANLNRLRDYEHYYLLTDDEVDALTVLCILLDPKEINGKCIFLDDSMCGDSMNKFYELETVRQQMLVVSDIIIGGQQRQVRKIMFYKEAWIVNYYVIPIAILILQYQARKEEAERRAREEECSCCVIL